MARALIAPVWESFHPGEFEQPGPFAKAPTLALVDTARMVEKIEDQVIHARRANAGERRPGTLRG